MGKHPGYVKVIGFLVHSDPLHPQLTVKLNKTDDRIFWDLCYLIKSVGFPLPHNGPARHNPETRLVSKMINAYHLEYWADWLILDTNQSTYCLSPRLWVFPLYAGLTANLISWFPRIQSFHPFYAMCSCILEMCLLDLEEKAERFAKRATFETRTGCKTGETQFGKRFS